MSSALLLFALLALLGSLGLYLLVANETANPRIVDRETAEREAKALGGLPRRNRPPRDEVDGGADRSDERTGWGDDRVGWHTDGDDSSTWGDDEER